MTNLPREGVKARAYEAPAEEFVVLAFSISWRAMKDQTANPIGEQCLDACEGLQKPRAQAFAIIVVTPAMGTGLLLPYSITWLPCYRVLSIWRPLVLCNPQVSQSRTWGTMLGICCCWQWWRITVRPWIRRRG